MNNENTFLARERLTFGLGLLGLQRQKDTHGVLGTSPASLLLGQMHGGSGRSQKRNLDGGFRT